jgi:hypothetical protein
VAIAGEAGERNKNMRTKHQRKLKRLFQGAGMVCVLLLLVLSTGCGSTKVSTQTNTNASVGQQLTDLQKAHDQGLINDKDYNKLKEAIIKKNE